MTLQGHGTWGTCDLARCEVDVGMVMEMFRRKAEIVALSEW